MQASPPSLNKISGLFRRFFGFIGKDKKVFVVNLLVMASVIVTGAILIWMVGKRVNSLLHNKSDSMLIYLLGFCLLVVLLQVLRYLNYYLHETMQQHAIFGIRRKLYSHILTLSTPYTNQQSSGDLLIRLGNDVVRISELVVLLPSNALRYIVSSIFFAAILFYIDPILALLSIALAPIFLLQQRFFIYRTRKTARRFLEYQGRMGGFEEEILNNIQGISSFNAEKPM